MVSALATAQDWASIDRYLQQAENETSSVSSAIPTPGLLNYDSSDGGGIQVGGVSRYAEAATHATEAAKQAAVREQRQVASDLRQETADKIYIKTGKFQAQLGPSPTLQEEKWLRQWHVVERKLQEEARDKASNSGLCATFGPLLEALPKENLDRTIPAERVVMLGQVSRGARAVLAMLQPAAAVHAKTGRIRELEGDLRCLLSWCRITDLRLHAVFLGGVEMAGLIRVLGQCACLAHLDLSKTSMGLEGVGVLGAELAQCGSLAHPDLSDNSIGSEGAGMIARVMGQWRSLAHLNLSDNSIGATGARRLARGCWGSAHHLLI